MNFRSRERHRLLVGARAAQEWENRGTRNNSNSLQLVSEWRSTPACARDLPLRDTSVLLLDPMNQVSVSECWIESSSRCRGQVPSFPCILHIPLPSTLTPLKHSCLRTQLWFKGTFSDMKLPSASTIYFTLSSFSSRVRRISSGSSSDKFSKSRTCARSSVIDDRSEMLFGVFVLEHVVDPRDISR